MVGTRSTSYLEYGRSKDILEYSRDKEYLEYCRNKDYLEYVVRTRSTWSIVGIRITWSIVGIRITWSMVGTRSTWSMVGTRTQSRSRNNFVTWTKENSIFSKFLFIFRTLTYMAVGLYDTHSFECHFCLKGQSNEIFDLFFS